MAKGPDRNLPAAVPPVQYPLGHQHLGIRRLEIRALPKVLSPATFHLERTALQPAPLDPTAAAARRYSLPVRLVPLQLRQLQKM